MPRNRNRAARFIPDAPRRRPRKRLKFLLLTQLTCTGCFSATPFQSARVTEPGQSTGHLSVQRSEPRDRDWDEGYVIVEGGTRFPLVGGSVDMGVNGAFITYDPVTESSGRYGGIMFGLDTKFEVVPDVLAFDLPFRLSYVGAGSFHTMQFYPRAILSVPLVSGVELNLSATRFMFLGGMDGMPWGYSAGLALGQRGGTIIRPEIGVLDYPEGGDMIQFGIAITPEFAVPGKATAAREEPEGPVYGPADERTPH